MGFQKQILPECPSCKEKRFRTIESRKTADATRRRKRCECCGFRSTTYEVDSDFYSEAQKNLMLVSKLYALFGAKHLDSEQKDIKCVDCIHNEGSECALGFPEFRTSESFDCIHYNK